MESLTIDRSKHAWLVGNKTGEVFLSSIPGYVALSDPAYAAWQTANLLLAATNILSDGELAEVLNNAGQPAPTVAAAAGATPDWGNMPAADILAVKIALGVAITSTGTPALNATYPLDDVTQMQILRRVAGINNNAGAFPTGITSYTQLDIAGQPHTFSTAAEYLAWATACNLYGEQLAEAAMQPTPAWPSAPAAIA